MIYMILKRNNGNSKLRILEFIFSSVWHKTFRHLNIRKNGDPPNYCDADGDIVKKKE